MDVITKQVHLSIDGETRIQSITKTLVGYNAEYDVDIFQLALSIDGIEYTTGDSRECMEFAIIELQKQLPESIQFICCQTCKHGSYCPFGDQENEIFCFKEYQPKDKGDVIDIFASDNLAIPDGDGDNRSLQGNELLHWCEAYERINDGYYTYNDWNTHINK